MARRTRDKGKPQPMEIPTAEVPKVGKAMPRTDSSDPIAEMIKAPKSIAEIVKALDLKDDDRTDGNAALHVRERLRRIPGAIRTKQGGREVFLLR